MMHFIRNHSIRLLLLCFLFLSVAYLVEARPGGGHSSRRSSGGGSSGRSSGGGGRSSSWGGGSGGGGGSGSSVPLTGSDVLILIVVIVVILIVVSLASQQQNSISSASGGDYSRYNSKGNFRELDAIGRDKRSSADKLSIFKQEDPLFSETLFLDFAQNLFYEYYNRHGLDSFRQLQPFLANSDPAGLKGSFYEVVINAMHLTGVYFGNDERQLVVLVETNYTNALPDGTVQRVFAQVEWTFARALGVKSLPPEKMQAINCPSCGAPDSYEDGHSCRNCGHQVVPTHEQWALKYGRTLYTENYLAGDLVSYEQEQGTNNPTIYAPDLNEQKAKFAAHHQLADFDAYFHSFRAEIVRPTFANVYAAWSSKRWDKARHLMSDFLFKSLSFWLERYNEQSLTNKLENIQVGAIQLVKVDLDAYYETFTVRIYASCLDYTVRDSDAEVIGGDHRQPREFSEYWTFVRHADKHFDNHKQSPYDHLDNCPACGAPADKVSNAGSCGYCGNKLSTGEFSWILSRITQDEAYV